MGSCLRKKQRVSVAVVGLDNVGKSSIISHMYQSDDISNTAVVNESEEEASLKLSASNVIMPTSAVVLCEFKAFRTRFRVWDFSGQGRARHLWQEQCVHADACIYVINADDWSRLGVAKREFDQLIDHPAMKKRQPPILFFLNTSDDSPNNDDDKGEANEVANGSTVKRRKRRRRKKKRRTKTVTLQNVRGLFQSTIKRDFPTNVMACNGLSGTGVPEGFQWLLEALNRALNEPQ